ncbi:MAG: HDIG domain-containing protein [Spirochaetales bacterium]|nr:HDIG domain-containing protein [Spirochaetales bacterium]
MATPDRERAHALLRRYTKSESLINHALSVEAVMRHFAERYDEDPEQWGIIGLVHDLDWERYPEEHCEQTTRILREDGWPEEWIRAVRSHAWGMFTEDKPEHVMEKVLYTTDELTGLITATALVRPSRSILDMKVKSVKKKWKDKSFAAGANREVIAAGAELLGLPLDEVIEETLAGMQRAAARIGLAGELAADGA